jgi:hypothetical protein
LGHVVRVWRGRREAAGERYVQPREQEEHPERRDKRGYAEVDGDQAVDEPDERDSEQTHEDRERQIQEEPIVGEVHHDGRERERLADREVYLAADEQHAERRCDDHVRHGESGEREDVLLREEGGVGRLEVERQPHEDDEDAHLPHPDQAVQ